MKKNFKRFFIFIIANAFFSSVSLSQEESPEEKLSPEEYASKVYKRLTNTAPSSEALQQMVTKIKSGDKVGAAKIATADDNFINIVVKNMAKRDFFGGGGDFEGNINKELSDGEATIMGMVRDGIPFNQLLTGDFFYRLATNPTQSNSGYSTSNNNHYARAEAQGMNIAQELEMVQTSSIYQDIDSESAAGLFTTREFARIFYEAGTNRAPMKFISNAILCKNLEAISDPSRPRTYIRYDVFKEDAEGGIDQFNNYCAGCHGGFIMSGAFAYLDYDADDEKLIHTQDEVRPKYNINMENSTSGYITTSNWWTNHYIYGNTSNMGWKGANSGYGAKSLGSMLTQSDQFAYCMSEKVFSQICLHAPSVEQKSIVTSLASDFKNQDNYNMKTLFEKMATSVDCIK